MPDPDFSVNDVRLCVGKCPGSTAWPCCALGGQAGMGRVLGLIKAASSWLNLSHPLAVGHNSYLLEESSVT